MERFSIVGAALSAVDKDQILEQAKEFVHQYDEQEWRAFAQLMHYAKVDFTKAEDFKALTVLIERVEEKQALLGNRLIYCATSCNFFIPITRALVQSGILAKHSTTEHERWQRIAYEKPFGYDEVMACEIEQCATSLLDRHQIFHIDHFQHGS